MEEFKSILDKYRSGEATLVGILQEVSLKYNYLPEETLREISREIGVPVSLFYSLATFYKSFRLEPIGRKHICVCTGTACHVRGADRILETMERQLSLKAGETSRDQNYTLETVNCLGACAMGPLVTVNGEYYGKVDQKKLVKVMKQITNLTDESQGDQ